MQVLLSTSDSRARALLFIVSLLCCLLDPRPSQAYESGTTHPGLTARAMLQSSRLHLFLRQEMGLGLGLFTRVQLLPTALGRRELRELRRRLASLDPGGGYQPDSIDGQRAAGWLMAGSVLAGMPSSIEEDHFYSPVLRAGLDNSRPIVGSLLGMLSVIEGGDRLRQFLTGTGFDLRGTSALELVRAPHGPYSATVIDGHLADAIAAPEPRQREHNLVMALLAVGGLLHVLQDMASPTRTRNDFLPGHLQQLGSSSFDRGSAYERAVALAYGRLGVPRYRGAPVVRRRLLEFFTSSDWHGLADHTAAEHFSPGTLPPPVHLFPTSDAGELRNHLSSRLPFSRPALGKLNLSCARRRTCHMAGPNGPLLAYRMDSEGELRFFIDSECIAASARRLLPMAVGYSAGAIDFLLRGRLVLETEGEEILVRNGPQLVRSGRLRLLAEDARGHRRLLDTRKLPDTAADAMLARVPPVPQGSQRVLAVLEGIDENGEPLVAAGHMQRGGEGPSGFKATDIGVPTTRASTRPAAAPPATIPKAKAKPDQKAPKPGKKPPKLELVPKTK